MKDGLTYHVDARETKRGRPDALRVGRASVEMRRVMREAQVSGITPAYMHNRHHPMCRSHHRVLARA